MPDVGWIGDVVKIAGGGAGGWAIKTVTDRNRLRKTRMRLYKEMGRNYVTLRNTLDAVADWDDNHAGSRIYDLFRPLSLTPLTWQYFDFVRKDLDWLHSVPQSYEISRAYELLMQAGNMQSTEIRDVAELVAFLMLGVLTRDRETWRLASKALGSVELQALRREALAHQPAAALPKWLR